MRAYERFLTYIQLDTASDERNSACPSTEGQRAFANALAEELRQLGASAVRVDEHGYLYARLPATAEGAPKIGLIAHMDTVDAVPCAPMNARIVENYGGGEIALNESERISPQRFPAMAFLAGKSLIVTDGKTLLGADDKAGVAEIVTLCERLLGDPSIPHGEVLIGFTPDEEIGRGADLFDVAGFGADFAYTVDGGQLGEIEYENFNAASATVEISGVSIHPGSAKNQMKNALLMAIEFNSMLPPCEIPAHTEGYEGFYHLNALSGQEEKAEMRYIVRDHDRAAFEARKDRLRKIADYLNEKWGPGSFTLTLRDSYYNMREQIEAHMHVVERARRAYTACGIEPRVLPIRGGTDGARLSFMGLPCPNIATGGMNGHGRCELVAIEDMDKMVDVLEQIVRVGNR